MLRRKRGDEATTPDTESAEPPSKSSWEARAAKAEEARKAREAVERGEPVPSADDDEAETPTVEKRRARTTARPRWDNLAVVAALVSLMGMIILPFALGPLGIYLGWRARKRIQTAQAEGNPVGGLRLANAAMLVGGFAVVLWAVALIVSLTG